MCSTSLVHQCTYKIMTREGFLSGSLTYDMMQEKELTGLENWKASVSAELDALVKDNVLFRLGSTFFFDFNFVSLIQDRLINHRKGDTKKIVRTTRVYISVFNLP